MVFYVWHGLVMLARSCGRDRLIGNGGDKVGEQESLVGRDVELRLAGGEAVTVIACPALEEVEGGGRHR